jgi:cytochrome c-type biogenesis protein CcmH/NrfG
LEYLECLDRREDVMTQERTKARIAAASIPESSREPLVIAVVLAVTLASYIGTLWDDFVYDDDIQIVRNFYVQFWRHVPHYFISQVWSQMFPRAAGNYYRPLFLLWLRVNDALFGLRPAGWHAMSIALHLLVTLLVYFVARNLTNQMSVAAFTALVFGLHPMHAEVVAWISGATESLCAVFVLGAFLAYLKSRESDAVIWMTISSLLFGFAVFSKETGVVLPVLVFGHCWIYAQDSAAGTQDGVKRFMVCVRTVLWYAPMALFYLAVRMLVLRGLGHTVTRLTLSQVIFSIPSMVAFYVKKWFLPIHLDEFYDTPYWGTPNFWHVILPAFLVIAVFAAIWAARNYLGAREVKFALLWVIVPLLPVLDARMLPQDEMIHERYFYLPSVGAALLVGLLVDKWTRGPRVAAKSAASGVGSALVFGVPAVRVVAALVLATSLGLLTVQESEYWTNDYTLFQRGYTMAPHNPTVRLDYAEELTNRRDFATAQSVLTQALADNPNEWRAYLDLGQLDYQEGNFADAERQLRRASELDANSADAYANLGLADLHLGRMDDALGNLRTAVAIRPNDPAFLFAYGVILEANGNCILANDQFRAILDIRPGESYAEMQLARCQQTIARTSRN